jgi:predicted Zn finger-like uncharacterized protein
VTPAPSFSRTVSTGRSPLQSVTLTDRWNFDAHLPVRALTRYHVLNVRPLSHSGPARLRFRLTPHPGVADRLGRFAWSIGMPILVTCPSCGARINAPDSAAGRKAKCPKCGTTISIPAATTSPFAPTQGMPPHSVPPIPVGSPSTPLTHGASPPTSFLRCKVCDHGTLLKKKIYRMSTAVVVIGYILLVPSILGIIVSVIVALIAASATGVVSDQTRAETRSTLQKAGVPEPIIQKVIRQELIPDADLARLTPDQKAKVLDGIMSLVMARAGGALGGLGVIGGALCFGVSFFVGGLLGWLLVMKKKVLRCGTCGAVVAAS